MRPVWIWADAVTAASSSSNLAVFMDTPSLEENRGQTGRSPTILIGERPVCPRFSLHAGEDHLDHGFAAFEGAVKMLAALARRVALAEAVDAFQPLADNVSPGV